MLIKIGYNSKSISERFDFKIMKNKLSAAAAITAALAVFAVGCGNTEGDIVSLTEFSTLSQQDADENFTADSSDETSNITDNISETDSLSASSSVTTSNSNAASTKTAAEIVAGLTLEQKANQMVQGAIYNVESDKMKSDDYGSILSTFGEYRLGASSWLEMIRSYQKSALESDSKIPFIYGQDSVHGVNYCLDTVIFPHNIGIGAANDAKLSYEMGLAVADEIKMTGMIWNFSPCVAQAQDLRWGRTYESYSSETDIVKNMSVAYSKGLIEGGVLPCAKHFFGDGNTKFGTGEKSDANRLIDRGDAELTEEETDELLSVYGALINAGVKTIMISHSSVNGVKMHENAKYISYLKNEMGFDGFIVSDWNSIHNISGSSLREKTITAVNAGIDMLMEPDDYEQCAGYIVDAANNGDITNERIDDAVTRIVSVKMSVGLFDDPTFENIKTKQTQTGSDEYRELARTLAEESLVLIKNENEILPLKDGEKLFVTGPAADDTGVQCGGWTLVWNGKTDAQNGNKKWVEGATTIKAGFEELAKTHNYTLVNSADKADVIILCIGEKPYAEWNGDTDNPSITGGLALDGNKSAIEAAKSSGKPVVACIVAGRNVIISDYENDWSGIVMCYLPGSEGNAVANVLSGDKSFRGKLPMPYYASAEDITSENYEYPVGYGLSYKK